MDIKDEIFQRLKNAEFVAERKRYDAMPQLFFFIGLGGGLLLNLASNIIYESGKNSAGNIFEVVVLILTFLFIIFFIWYIEKFHLKPIRKIELEIADLKKKLKND